MAIGDAMARRFKPPGHIETALARPPGFPGAPSPSSLNGRGTCVQSKSSTSPVQVQYKSALGGAARLDFPGFDLLRVLYVPFV